MTTTPEPEPLEETPDLYGAYPRLSPEGIQALAALGERRQTHAGDVLYQAGARHYGASAQYSDQGRP